jgi:hypothetical protein
MAQSPLQITVLVPGPAGNPRALLSLQSSLSRGDGHRIRLNQRVYNVAADFTELVDALVLRPTCLQELVPTPSIPRWRRRRLPSRYGRRVARCDRPRCFVVRRHTFPPRVAADLVTFEHPRGSI